MNLKSIHGFKSAVLENAMQQDPVSSYFDTLRDEIPETFLQKLRQSFTFVYEDAFGRSFLDIFDKPEARDYYGYTRRALTETQLAKIAAECGLPCEVHSNKKQTEHHRVVRIGRLFATCSAVRTPQQKPRSAHFRKQAALSPLFAFPTFDFLPPPEHLKTDSIYIVIVHGHNYRDLNRPAFVGIGIPDRDWKHWLELTSLDTLLEAQKLRRQVTDRERITDRAQPKIKPAKKKEDEGQ